MQVLIGLRNPNHDSSEDVSVRSHWGLIQVPLNVRDIPQLVGRNVDVWFIVIARLCLFENAQWFWSLYVCALNFQRQAYSELNLTTGQLGIDDNAHIHPGTHKKCKYKERFDILGNGLICFVSES